MKSAKQVTAMLDITATVKEFVSTLPAFFISPSPIRRAVIACVPTEMALKKPPKAQSKINEGPIAAVPITAASSGRRPTIKPSIMLMAVCVSIPMMTGTPSRMIRRAKIGSTPKLIAAGPGSMAYLIAIRQRPQRTRP